MRLLVTGAAGFIGQNLLHRLAGHPDYTVWALDRNAMYAAPPSVTLAGNVTLCTSDAGSTDAIAEHRIDTVVHLAGSTGVRESDANPLDFIDNNVRATAHIFEQARQHGVRRVVYASSSSVYGLTKAMCDDLAAYYGRRHGLSCIGLRFFTVYGRYGRPDMAVARFTTELLAGRPVTVFGSGEQTRDFTHVDDAVDAIMAALEAPVMSGVYDVGPRTPIAVNRLIDIIAEELGVLTVDRVHTAGHAADALATLADPAPLYRDLHVRPAVGAEDGVRSYVRWRKTTACCENSCQFPTN